MSKKKVVDSGGMSEWKVADSGGRVGPTPKLVSTSLKQYSHYID